MREGEAGLQWVAVLEQTPTILERMLLAATDEQMEWKPSEARWSISEVLAHLVDVEEDGFRSRFEMMTAKDMAVLPSYDQNARYAEGWYSNGHPRENLLRFCQERGRTLGWLRTRAATLGKLRGTHEALGMIRGGELLSEWAFHDLGHIRQVAELYRARAFFPAMGAFRKYYQIHP
jgi:hypothetical protein